jgi:plasmid stability protein
MVYAEAIERGDMSLGKVILENLDDGTVERLKLRAAATGRSLEDEIKAILADQLAPAAKANREARIAQANRLRAMTLGWSPETDSVAVIRAPRDSRH